MNQADVTKLISQLKIKINPRHRNLKNIDGPEGRLLKLRKTVTALFKHERIELNFNRADEARGYAELLISEARRYGDCHRTTMELADYWLLEKQLVHKLFKVLVPRFHNCNTSCTRMYRAPFSPGVTFDRAVLELKGNPYPTLIPDTTNNRNLLHNVLMDEARKEYRANKYLEMAEQLQSSEPTVASSLPEEPAAISVAQSASSVLKEPTISSAESSSSSEPKESKT